MQYYKSKFLFEDLQLWKLRYNFAAVTNIIIEKIRCLAAQAANQHIIFGRSFNESMGCIYIPFLLPIYCRSQAWQSHKNNGQP